jgi:glycosyltransferase involved in cell wall biosynthesis
LARCEDHQAEWEEPLVTVAVPSLNQGRYLDEALASIFAQNLPVEVFVADGGSTDSSLAVIDNWKEKLAGYRSYPDEGQAAAVNECIARGKAPFVMWLNSDDYLLPDGVGRLLNALQKESDAPAAYGKVWNARRGRYHPARIEPFDERRLAVHCIIGQPGTLIRRWAWEDVGGVDPTLYAALDYDLWWRLYRAFGPLVFLDEFVAVNREHAYTKTNRNRRLHYREAMRTVRDQYGRLPLKWWIAQPYAVWWRGALGWVRKKVADTSGSM